MKIIRLKNVKFGTKKISRVVTGWALYEEGKGYIAFSCDRDKYGILVPYIPCGGKRALQSILDAGGFCSLRVWNMYRSWEPKSSRKGGNYDN